MDEDEIECYNDLMIKYPMLLNGRTMLEYPTKWHKHVSNLLFDIHKICEVEWELYNGLTIAQIKEKFNKLRVYLNPIEVSTKKGKLMLEFIVKLIDIYEDESGEIK